MIQKCCCKGRTNVPFLDVERKEEETGPRGYIAQGNFAPRTKKELFLVNINEISRYNTNMIFSLDNSRRGILRFARKK